MGSKQIEFESGRAMKNTYRFQERTSTDSVIGTPYVQKTLFGWRVDRQQVMISIRDNCEDSLKYTADSCSMVGGGAGLNA